MKIYLIVISLLFSACTTLPPAFDSADIQELTYAQVKADTEKYKDVQVKWGGVVTDLKEVEDGSLMQVMLYPLDYYDRPDIDKPSEGYFLLKSEKKLDSKIYFTSREIVAIGTIEGKSDYAATYGSAGLPLINAVSIHPWPIAYRENYYYYCPTCYFKQLFW
ncbi:outer membrane lipoprotein [Nitrosomonas marina]|uniref:Outer membrane lipoprotein n=1 Tax=Nitrosomonas marina TaxID=917 RepID=A0A1H9YI49_9PROT|nr:Slp family lipoprotein [Nitrosomonas marina]SES68737.1 outer membrane lipoprotein [Nitrosomonas marina]